MSTWCKICGVRDTDTALAVAAAGADAIGLNFSPRSARRIDVDVAGPLTAALRDAAPDVARVGIFADATAEAVQQVLDVCDLTLLQFHGGETPAFCERFARPYVEL